MRPPAPWRRPVGRWTITALVVGGLFVLGGIVGLVAHYRAPGNEWTIGLSAVVPFMVLGSVVGAVLVGMARQWAALSFAVVVAAWGVALQAPLFTSEDAPRHAVRIEVMSFNLHVGGADAAQIVQVARARNVQLLMLEELTPEELTRLDAAGIDRLFPHHIAVPAVYGVGTGLWSRFPLTETAPLASYTFRFISATARVPGLAAPLAVVAVHVAGPVPVTEGWRHDMRLLPADLRRVARTGRSVIVAGDFNATRDVVQFRSLLAAGYADAADQSGAGFTPTYPADRWFGPVLAIDHVLTRNAVATSFDSLGLRDSDHRAVIASVAVPTG